MVICSHTQLVTNYLKELGTAAIGQFHLFHAEMDGHSQQQTRYWCKQMGLAVRGILPELKLRLKEHIKLVAN